MISISSLKIVVTLILFTTLIGCSSMPQHSKQPVAVPLNYRATVNNYLRLLATQAALKYRIDQRLFHALIKHESAWNPRAISRAGARGLTQIMPLTGKIYCGLERDVLFDPKMNLECGAFYFSKLLRRFNNVKLALAAYNSGETRVAKLGRVPRIRETQRYVRRVMASWRNNY
jgi:soluble lytic murein transglycosylase-like protein